MSVHFLFAVLKGINSRMSVKILVPVLVFFFLYKSLVNISRDNLLSGTKKN